MSTLTQKLSHLNSSFIERAINNIKHANFFIINELLQYQINSVFLLIILLVIEGGQFLWFILHPNFPFLWTSELFSYFKLPLKYLQVDFFLRESGQGIYFALLYIAALIQILMILGIIYVLTRPEKVKKKHPPLLVYVYKFMSIYALLLKTIAPLPLYQIFFTSIICKEGDPIRSVAECYTGIHIANLVVGIVGIISLTAFAVITQLLFVDLNPCSHMMFASLYPNVDFLRLATKVFIPIYFVLDAKFQATKGFIVTFGLAWSLLLIFRYHFQSYYNNLAAAFAVSCESLVFWAVLVVNFHAFLDNNNVENIGFIYFILGAPFVMYTYHRIFKRKKWQIMGMDMKSFSRPKEIEMYINITIQFIEKKDNPNKRLQLEGLLRQHVRSCYKKEDECPCFAIAATTNNNKEETTDNPALWHSFIKAMLKEAISVFPKSQRLHLLHAYFQLDKLKNKFKALFELMAAEENNPSIQQDFSVYRYKKLIEKLMADEEIRSANSKQADISHIVEYQEKLVALQQEIGKVVIAKLEFWRELERQNPNILRLLVSGEKVTIQIERVKEFYDKLHELNPNHIKMLQTYGNFVKNILNDNTQGHRILEKADYLRRSMQASANFLGNDLLKYEGNGDMCIITCSGNPHSMGTILNASAEIQRIVQYLNTEIIGQNISYIMPRIYGRLHDGFMKRWIESPNSQSLGIESLVFPMNKAGYIIPCTILIKILPNLNEGLKMVGFLNEAVQAGPKLKSQDDSPLLNHYIAYGGENNAVQGVSESCYQAFGIPARLTLGTNIDLSEFTIDKIFPDILVQNKQEMKDNGLLLKINTVSLPQDFIIDKDNSEINDESESAFQKRYREAQVRVILVEDKIYNGNVNVNVIKFSEQLEEISVIPNRDTVNMATRGQNESPTTNKTKIHGADLTVSQSEVSNGSVGITNEEDMVLKDLKQQISTKKAPLFIRSLKRISFLGVILLGTLVTIQLAKQSSINDEMNSALYTTSLANERYDIIAQLTFKIKTLNLLANDIIRNQTSMEEYESALRSDISNLLARLSYVEFIVIQGGIDMERNKGEGVPSYEIQSLLDDATIAKNFDPYTKAVWVFIGVAQKINNYTLSVLKDNNEAIRSLFFYIETNGIESLREGSEHITDSFINFYSSRTKTFDTYFLITSIVGIVLVIAFEVYVFFKIFSVNKTNITVLALFGHIPTSEIQELIAKCEQYLEAYQNEILMGDKDNSYEEVQQVGEPKEDENDAKDLENSRDQSRHDPLGPLHTDTSKILTRQEEQALRNNPKGKSMTVFDSAVDQSKSTLPLMTNPFFRETKVADEKTKHDDNLKEENFEELEEKSKNMANSKEYRKRNAVIQIFTATAVFIIYFALRIWFELNYTDIFQVALDHLGVISQRKTNLRYATLFCLKEIIDDANSTSSRALDKSYRGLYAARVYQNQRTLKTVAGAFPVQFDNYVEQVIAFNNDDTCLLLYGSDPDKLADCKTLNNDSFVGGLIQREIRLLDGLTYVSSDFEAAPVKTRQVQIDILNGANFQLSVQLIESIHTAESEIVQSFLKTYDNYLRFIFKWEQILGAGFIVLVVVTFLFLWLPYLQRLSTQTLRTKSLMNVIPIHTLKKNKSLKEAFTTAGILKTVK